MKTFLLLIFTVFMFFGCYSTSKPVHVHPRDYTKEINIKNKKTHSTRFRYKQAKQWSKDDVNKIEETIILD